MRKSTKTIANRRSPSYHFIIVHATDPYYYYSRNGQIYYTPLAAQYIRDNTYLIINAKYTTSVRICSSLFGACVDNYYNTHTRRNLIFAINHGGAYIICARK